jgi:signal transduction histidine kinase
MRTLDFTPAQARAHSDMLEAGSVTAAERYATRARIAHELDGDDVIGELYAVRLSIAELSVSGDYPKLGKMVGEVVRNYVDRIADIELHGKSHRPSAEAVALQVLMEQA